MLISCLPPVMTVPVMPALSVSSYVNLHANDNLRLWADELEVPMELLMRGMLTVGSDMGCVTEWICGQLA